MPDKRYCPECGGKLRYDPPVKLYTCLSCGRVYTWEQLIEARHKLLSSLNNEEDVKKKRKEMLKWWLSKEK